MIDCQPISMPTEPGWYTGRMKSWPVTDGYAPIKITDRNGKLVAWQCADERPWPLETFDWRDRFWP